MSAKNNFLIQIEKKVRIYANSKYQDTNVRWVLFILAEYSYYQDVFNQILDNLSLKIIKLQKSNTCIPLYFLLICIDPHIGRKVSPLNILFWYKTVRLGLKLVIIS